MVLQLLENQTKLSKANSFRYLMLGDVSVKAAHMLSQPKVEYLRPIRTYFTAYFHFCPPLIHFMSCSLVKRHYSRYKLKLRPPFRSLTSSLG